ncbi:MAG: response regulator [Candidatus Kapabacteria bacterium]|jgi:two-component system chemotaxis response regulator CheY|nr:response regulator [Candidatus Kapabacteria bacterium]
MEPLSFDEQNIIARAVQLAYTGADARKTALEDAQAMMRLVENVLHIAVPPTVRFRFTENPTEADEYTIWLPTLLKNQAPFNILLLEDDLVSATVLQEILGEYGECTLTNNGAETIRLFDEAISLGKAYNLVSLDIMVPEINGQEVLAHIRQTERKRGLYRPVASKVMMTTALGDFGNIRTAYKHDCDRYLPKPLSREVVTSALRSMGIRMQ